MTLALGDLAGLSVEGFERAEVLLADQIAIAFRGCLSFWVAGEISDDRLPAAVATSTATTLLGFVSPDRRERLLRAMGLPCRSGSE